MHDSCLHFIPGVSSPDHEKCITLSHFNYRLTKTQHLRLHLIEICRPTFYQLTSVAQFL